MSDSSTSNRPTSPSNEPAVGLAAAGLSLSRGAMLDLVNRLHNTGVGLEIDLPLIAVIGSQSAGKSSLIESMSGITLPRAAGTCTRCPTECRLTRSDESWKGIVKLHLSTDARGQPIPVRNVPFGPTIRSKVDIEERIRHAQRAILNPSVDDVTRFLTEDLDEEGSPEIDFSNWVSLEICGPDMADLSFIDLPGLIQSTGSRGRESDIQLVESLVTSYISKSNCLILLTVTCETDFQTQGAQRLAKKYDPEGNRTIGVLTKPDRIPTGDEDLWLKLIRNEDEPLQHSWAQEDLFFQTRPPWSELDIGLQRNLRTSNLVERLSSLLSDLISEKLPDIQCQISEAILDCRASLLELANCGHCPYLFL
ncbi:P-loop containing nucleoside triphosphate hydrolase protein [Flagelloscypha sp. PMI_526]|nr:P-loop containing nucleoside triphosphate hydrolase protein [Flagelloscypha sp. PMI_526]